MFVDGSEFDQGQMLIDFGLIKKWANDFIDAFDHSMMIWNIEEDANVVKFIGENFERVIVTPFASSAETQAKMFAEVMYRIVEAYKHSASEEEREAYFPSGTISGATVHETETGYATFMLGEDARSLPSTRYPIKVFAPSEVSKVLEDKNAIWLSSQIVSEMKHGQDMIAAYNDYVNASKY